ncbi:hypothetical protein HOO65_010805 [Ceratocystis lukuohia]|uniref:Uncharacterized protein n=1 Tax=Ceratocystis lukuohia TaxID=2019550 RepID=A0ABR4MT54_9PEZI
MKLPFLLVSLPILVAAVPLKNNQATSPGPQILAPALANDNSVDDFVQKTGQTGFPSPYAKELVPKGYKPLDSGVDFPSPNLLNADDKSHGAAAVAETKNDISACDHKDSIPSDAHTAHARGYCSLSSAANNFRRAESLGYNKIDVVPSFGNAEAEGYKKIDVVPNSRRDEALGYKKADVASKPSKAYLKLDASTNAEAPHLSRKGIYRPAISLKGPNDEGGKILALHSGEPEVSDPVVSRTTAHDIKYFVEEDDVGYCQAKTAQFYRLDFGPLARRGDCADLAEYLEREPGYFIATELNQLTPLAVMNSCYIQVIRKIGTSDTLRFTTSDVAAILRSFLEDYSGLSDSSVIHSAIGTTKCNGHYLGWSVTGAYNHTVSSESM